MKANDMQVGGDHYRKDYQHWDLVSDTQLGYLEGCSTKYISRWRDKAGLQDLEKSVHYLMKAKEGFLTGVYTNRSFFRSTPTNQQEGLICLNRFLHANEHFTMPEIELTMGICNWKNDIDLSGIIDRLRAFITSVEAGEVKGWPVPPATPTKATGAAQGSGLATFGAVIGSNNPEAHDYAADLVDRDGMVEPFGYQGDG